MNSFAGSVTFMGEADLAPLPFLALTTEALKGRIVFVIGETEFENSQGLKDFICARITGDILAYDISISTEDTIRLVSTELPASGNYSFIAFHGKTFREVLALSEAFGQKVVSVREAEESDKLGGRVVKVDIVTPNH